MPSLPRARKAFSELMKQRGYGAPAKRSCRRSHIIKIVIKSGKLWINKQYTDDCQYGEPQRNQAHTAAAGANIESEQTDAECAENNHHNTGNREDVK